MSEFVAPPDLAEKPAMDTVERMPLGSKKFIAYVCAEFGWKAILVLFVLYDVDWWIVLVTVIVSGFVQVGYIGGQAWLDRYVRVARMSLGKADGEGKSQ